VLGIEGNRLTGVTHRSRVRGPAAFFQKFNQFREELSERVRVFREMARFDLRITRSQEPVHAFRRLSEVNPLIPAASSEGTLESPAERDIEVINDRGIEDLPDPLLNKPIGF
jgi:hypothetical protein